MVENRFFITSNSFFYSNPHIFCSLRYIKINDPILADNIFNFRVESYGQSKLQEWDVVRSDEFVNMDELYMGINNDIDGLTTKIFNFVRKKMNERVIHDSNLNDAIPYLIDSIYNDCTKIIFNDYTKLNNIFLIKYSKYI